MHVPPGSSSAPRSRAPRLRALAATATLASAGILGGAAAAVPAQAADTAQVSVLHAVPGLTVDVYANGAKLLTDFKPGTLAGPLKLPADTYDITVFAAGKGPKGTPAIEKSVDVPAGANATVVAHLSAAGKPVLDAYVNDVSKVPAGQARLTVRHTAAAPAVDVRAGGTPVIKGLTNPNEKTLEVPAGSLKADVVLAGTDTVAIGPATLDLAEGSSTIVYAWGSAADKNLELAVQTISGMHSGPNGVPGGEAGLVAENGTPVGVTAGGIAVLGLAGVALLTVTRRRVAVRR